MLVTSIMGMFTRKRMIGFSRAYTWRPSAMMLTSKLVPPTSVVTTLGSPSSSVPTIRLPMTPPTGPELMVPMGIISL